MAFWRFVIMTCLYFSYPSLQKLLIIIVVVVVLLGILALVIGLAVGLK